MGDVTIGVHGVPNLRFCAPCGVFRRWFDPLPVHGLAPCRRNPASRPQGYHELKNICVWAKNNGGMGSLYRSQHELVFVFKSGTNPHINNVELGKHRRYRTNIWSYPGVNSFGNDRSDLALHPTVKPVALVADAIRDCSHRKGIVLDAFAGSGTTMIAAERTGRPAATGSKSTRSIVTSLSAGCAQYAALKPSLKVQANHFKKFRSNALNGAGQNWRAPDPEL